MNLNHKDGLPTKIRPCQTPYCRNKAAKGRKICWNCKYKQFKELHPMEWAFNNLRKSAKRRGKTFTITIEDFKAFAYPVNLLVGRGRTKESWHIDRIDDTKGYEPGNLQLLTCSENVKKQRKREKLLRYDWESKQADYKEIQLTEANEFF